MPKEKLLVNICNTAEDELKLFGIVWTRDKVGRFQKKKLSNRDRKGMLVDMLTDVFCGQMGEN